MEQSSVVFIVLIVLGCLLGTLVVFGTTYAYVLNQRNNEACENIGAMFVGYESNNIIKCVYEDGRIHYLKATR
jgi:hypothetical protein